MEWFPCWHFRFHQWGSTILIMSYTGHDVCWCYWGLFLFLLVVCCANYMYITLLMFWSKGMSLEEQALNPNYNLSVTFHHS
jgi:hypothetical protein